MSNEIADHDRQLPTVSGSTTTSLSQKAAAADLLLKVRLLQRRLPGID